MCSCRWAHSRWAVTRKPKYSPRKPACLHLSRAAYIWERWASGTTGMLKTYLMYFEVVIPQQKCFFQAAQLFGGCLHISCSVSTSTLSRMRTQPHTRKRKIHVASPMSCLTRTNWYSLENTNKLLLPFLQLARKAKILFWPRVFVQITEALAFMRQRKLYSTVMLVTAERKMSLTVSPPSSWLVINQLLLFLLFFPFILRTERSITETFLSW